MHGRAASSAPASSTCKVTPVWVSTKRERMPMGRVAWPYATSGLVKAAGAPVWA
jgi:hypothetical protein